MNNKSLHIISFDVPFPADYGGAIDVYYRIKSLHDLGVKITLHCYEYGRGKHQELEAITEKVYYYPRKKNLSDWFSKNPFIVQTRRSRQLMNRLLEDDSAILFEGLHTTFWLNDKRLKERTKIVRTHNIEHHYYGHLAANASGRKAMFFRSEAKKLERYEPVLNHANHVLSINKNDAQHFKHYKPEVSLLPPCFDKSTSFTQNSTDNYCLFHGNLSVSENIVSVKWLIDNIFSATSTRLIIAGKNPSEDLIALNNDHISIISNPTEKEMHRLISNARVHVLHTTQTTGVKLKLIQSLQTSGHVLVNSKMVSGTSLGDYCTVIDSEEKWNESIKRALNTELTVDEIEARRELFEVELNTLNNCETKILPLL